MSRAYAGGLSLEIPEGWDDQSMITLIGPPLEGPKLLRAKATHERLSLVLKREPLTLPLPALETFADAQEKMMANLMPGTRVDAKGTMSVGTAVPPISALTREFVIPNPAGELRQLQVYFFVDEGLFVLAGTAPNDMRFEMARKKFTAIISGIRIESE